MYELRTSHGDKSELIFGLSRDISCRTYSIGSLAYSYRGSQFHFYDKGGKSDPSLDVLYVPQTVISTEYLLYKKCDEIPILF